MNKQKVVLFVTAPIIAQGLKLQLESWGFSPVELVTSCAQALASAKAQPPCLVILDTELKEAEIDCFVLARQLQGETLSIPIIFTDKHLKAHLPYGQRNKTRLPYPYAFVNNPCHEEQLWQAVYNLL